MVDLDIQELTNINIMNKRKERNYPIVLKQLSEKELNSLTKDQIKGRSPVLISGVEGYIDGDGVWKSTSWMNLIKKIYSK